MGAYLNKDGIKSNDRIVSETSQGNGGSRVNLGFFGGNGYDYTHVKTNAGGSADRMLKFEYDGYTYSSQNVHNSVTFYTYSGTSSPYQPSLVNWGGAGDGIVSYYYSTDDYVVIVVKTNQQYTGGFLYAQSGASHTMYDIDVLAYASSASTSGVY